MINKRTGFLPFINIDQYSDWQLRGYYKNAVLSLKKVPKDVLVGFRTPDFLSSTVTAPTSMLIRKIEINDDVVSVVSFQTVTSGLTKYTFVNNRVTYSYYYRNSGVFSADSADYLTSGCIYDIYIIDSNNNEFISEPFLAIDNIVNSVTKPIYKRTGFLPFALSGQEHDWQIYGYWLNWVLSLKKVAKTSLVSFRTPLINADLTTPAKMTIRHLKILRDVVSVISSQEIDSGLLKDYQEIDETVYSYYYRQYGTMSITLTEGCIYDIYITDGINIFISDIFLAINESDQEYYLNTEDNQDLLTELGEKIIVE